MVGIIGSHTMWWKAAKQLHVAVAAQPTEAIGCHDLHAVACVAHGSAVCKKISVPLATKGILLSYSERENVALC
jgi:hypothetical protein